MMLHYASFNVKRVLYTIPNRVEKHIKLLESHFSLGVVIFSFSNDKDYVFKTEKTAYVQIAIASEEF